jgi:type IV pilus assembly protein PilA
MGSKASSPNIPNRKANPQMLSTIQQRLDRDDDQGFTLIELMVVVLIIAILLAIAIPTFLGARNSANARAAQSDLNTAQTAEQTYWTNNQAWGTTATTPAISTIEPNITWVVADTAPAKGNNVSASTTTADSGILFLQATGSDGNCYVVQLDNDSSLGTVAYATGYGEETGVCTPPTAAQAATAVSPGNATQNASAAGTWPTMYNSW